MAKFCGSDQCFLVPWDTDVCAERRERLKFFSTPGMKFSVKKLWMLFKDWVFYKWCVDGLITPVNHLSSCLSAALQVTYFGLVWREDSKHLCFQKSCLSTTPYYAPIILVSLLKPFAIDKYKMLVDITNIVHLFLYSCGVWYVYSIWSNFDISALDPWISLKRWVHIWVN